MGWLHKAVEEGVSSGMNEGFVKAAYERCDGRDDPEDRCPSTHVCVCAWVNYTKLPWYKQAFIKDKPVRPTTDQAVDLAIGFAVEQALEDMKCKQEK